MGNVDDNGRTHGRNLESAELRGQLHKYVFFLDALGRVGGAGGERWLELISYAWPCAPKTFRFLEGIVYYIGSMTQAAGSAPDEKANVPDFLQIPGAYLDSDTSHRLYNAAIRPLSEFVREEFQPPIEPNVPTDQWFASLLTDVLDSPTPEKTYLAALLLQRILLFRAILERIRRLRMPETVPE